MIDRDIHLARALLVESNPLLRSVGAAQLRDAGVGHVAQTSRVKDARLLLEREHFDIVLCNREFEGSAESGQDLLDELRRERLLPHSTVFLMVTAKVSYAQVVEAAEAALDGFLVRPFTAAMLGAKLLEARNRKRELADVIKALDAGESEVALARAVKRFQEQQPYWTYCGRLAAELLLTLNRPADACRVFERLAQAKNGVSWARLGTARAQIALGDNTAARKTVAEVLAAEPDAADAHDLMGRILVDECDFNGALERYRKAAELTPGCLLRAQHVGALAFYQGRADEALKWLEICLGLGVQSKLFDALSLLLLAMLRHDRGDAKGVLALNEQLRGFAERFPGSKRLARLALSAGSLAALLGNQPAAALASLRGVASLAGQDDFDLEAANIAIALWTRVPEAVRPAAEYEALLEQIGMRFCVSKAIAEVLSAAAGRTEPATGAIRRCQARVAALTEQAMEASLAGDPGAAARLLLSAGEKTLNAKLLEMAGQIARRHQASIADSQAIGERAAAVLRRSCQAANHIAGIQRSGRSPGGLQVRGRSPAGNAADTAHAAA